MLFHTLISISLITVGAVAFSAFALIVAAGSLFYAFIRMKEHSKRMARYINMSKFNHIEISHHNARLSRLENKLNIKFDPQMQSTPDEE